MKTRVVFLSFILCFVLLNLNSPAQASASKVKVSIPKFTVEINGQKIDNLRAQFPPLLYKNVLYLPLTWNVAHALDLYVQRDKTAGLTIQSGSAKSLMKDDRQGKNTLSNTYFAQTAAFSIKVNGETINNVSQKYPFLQFRDITYIPMTWHITHELFKWDTEKTKTSYHIRTGQVPVFFRIVYDDANFLYVSIGDQGILKISKALDGKFTRISEKESRPVLDKYEALSGKYVMPKGQDSDEKITTDEKAIYYNGQLLLSLEPYLSNMVANPETETGEENSVQFMTNLVKLDDNKSLLMVTGFYRMDIPAPYTPREERVFVIREGKAIPVEGFTQRPDKLIKNPDGTCWISSYAPPRYDMNTVDFDRRAQLAFIDKNGIAHNLNQQLKAQDIDLLYADDQLVFIKAYNDRLEPGKAAKTDGFYKIDSRLSATKIADSMPGIGYVGQNKHVFAMDPEKNTITDMMTKKSHRWWDYELRTDLLR